MDPVANENKYIFFKKLYNIYKNKALYKLLFGVKIRFNVKKRRILLIKAKIVLKSILVPLNNYSYFKSI